jgi:hypothetical protein
MRRAIALVLLSMMPLAIGACTDLPAVPTSTCGNGVVDAQEDCDTFAAEAGTKCGEPTSASPCRFVCASTPTAIPCPGGFTCGVDGLCRTGNGRFTLAGRPIQAAATTLQVADFDGDGREDILSLTSPDGLGRAAGKALFFGSGLESVVTAQVPGLLGVPIKARLRDQSKQDDLVFTSFPGMSALLSQTDRTFTSKPYPQAIFPESITAVIDLAVDAVPASTSLLFQGDELLVAADVGGLHKFFGLASTQTFTLSANVELDAINALSIVDLPRPLDELAGEGAENPADGWRCPSLIFAYTGSPDVQVVTPCSAQPGPTKLATNGTGTLDAVALKYRISKDEPLRSAQVAGQAQLFDLDRDGHLDLVVGGAIDEFPSAVFAFVSFGDGTGKLSSPPGTIGGLTAMPGVAVPVAGASVKGGLPFRELPLAFGFFDGDDQLDFVLPDGIVLSSPDAGFVIEVNGSPRRVGASNLGSPWVEAVVGDFNNDGVLDVIAASPAGFALDLLTGTPGGTFNPSSIPINGAAALLRTGDLNGDGLLDLAFREEGTRALLAGQTATSKGLGDSLAILFGTGGEQPTEVVRQGRFDRLQQINPGNIPNAIFPDAITDLGVVYQGNDAPGLHIGQLLGSGDRQLRAPLGLKNAAGEGDLPLLLAAGHFIDAKDQQSVAALVVRVDQLLAQKLGVSLAVTTSVSLLPFRDQALTDTISQSAALPATYALTGDLDDVVSNNLMLPGDLDGDGIDELVLIAPPSSAAVGSDLLVARAVPATGVPPFVFGTAASLPVGLRFDRASEAAVVDIDGDGARDLVLLSTATDQAGALLVLWNDGQGGVGAAAPTTVQAPGDAEIKGFCVLDRKAGGAHTLALATSGGLFLMRAQGGGRVLAGELISDANTGRVFPAAKDIACGDFDGDGVNDLAVNRDSVVQMYRGQPVR